MLGDSRVCFALKDCIFFRTSHQRCSIEKGVLRNFKKFTGKQLCQSLCLHKVAGHSDTGVFLRILQNF